MSEAPPPAIAPLTAISVDLDSLAHYCRIHGLDEAGLDDRARDVVARVAVPRFLELLAGAPATFFVIGEDVDGALAGALATAHRAGVELASHSHSHDYRMRDWTVAEVRADLRRAHDAITAIAGVPPVGFRAPGYSLSAAMVEALAGLGYRYDASVFPAAPYYLAKAAVLAGQRLFGRRSRSSLDTPRVLAAPLDPYRPSLTAPYRRGTAPLVELPVAVEPFTRVPFIGTLATAAPPPVVELVRRSLSTRPLVSFELHAIDVLDGSDGIPAALARVQPDVGVPARVKLTRLAGLFQRLRWGRQVVTLAEAARRFEPVIG